MNAGRDNAGVIAPPPLLALAALALGLLLDWVAPAYVLAVVLPNSERIALSAFCVTCGAGLALSAALKFRRAGTHVEPWKPANTLVTDGIFRWLRNPMYVGLVLFVAGLGIALKSDWTLVMIVPLAAVLHSGVVKREERYLENKFGDAYRQYKERVPRYGLHF